MVVVLRGLFLRSLSMVELEMWCVLIRVYVDSDDLFSVSQNGVYMTIARLHRIDMYILWSSFILDYSR